MELTPSFIRSELAKESVVEIDFAYAKPRIEAWWQSADKSRSNHTLKLELIGLFLSTITPDHQRYFESLGTNYISGVCITNVFASDDYELALIVHEALCELFHLNDIKYQYEEHKALFLKPSAESFHNWGNGHGEITPHSDDLYEEVSTDLLALTVCRDHTATPTLAYYPGQLFAQLSDDEIAELINTKATFKSGKNVDCYKEKVRPLIDFDPLYGVRIHLDFRNDVINGKRMVLPNEKSNAAVEKLMAAVATCSPVTSIPKTGTFFIVANYKLLHARAKMNLAHEEARLAGIQGNINGTPRLLYRSKGPRYEVSLKNGYSQFLPH
jgi:hypothetical protein